jgi:hypothetical protein
VAHVRRVQSNMRHTLISVLLAASAASAQAPPEPIGIPRIGSIEFYGLHQVTPQLARQALGLSEGSPLPASKSEAEERLTDIDLVAAARVEAVCCENGTITLYVGIEERGQPGYEVRPAPGGASELPPAVRTAYQDLQAALHAAGLRGPVSEDLSKGYPLSSNPAARALQEKLPAVVSENLADLREVLRDSGDEYQRAIAADLLPYAPNKNEIVNDLRDALSDSDPLVRSNAVHSLTALALLERTDAGSRVRVSPTWFIDMLQSLVWTDRTKAAWALDVLTEDRDVFTLSRLRGPAIEALLEMAVWKTRAHAQSAFFLLGRAAGFEESRIQAAWMANDRRPILDAAAKMIGR